MELRDRRQWVVWREEFRDGKPTKVPYCPQDPTRRAKANDPATWSTFDEALRVAKANGFEGIGYEFSAQDPFCGVDLDGCRDAESSTIKPWAQEIITRLNSYSEVSPSGRGVHILVKGKLPPGPRRKGQVEMYSEGRYFTVTGLHLEGTPTSIENRQTELEALGREIFGQEKKEPPRVHSTSPILELSDRELLDRAQGAGDGEKFARLWRGDTTGYDSPSEATAALLSKLVFWCGPDPERIDRLFQQSGLMREKWNRPQSGSTWGRLEIEKAIARAKEFYSPGQRAPAPNRSKSSQQTADQPLKAPAITPLLPAWPHEVMTGAAGAFARTYGAYLETPELFLFMNYLTLLGHLVSDRITLASEIAPQPRLYTVNLGESADTRKSTSINKTINFFLDGINREDINLIWGVGSAEGLAKAFSKHHRGILILDELKGLVQKMRIDASVLLPCINTLYELNRYHSLTKSHDIKIDNAELCLLAASTLDTYRNMFTSQFLDIGFINRLFIVIGSSERRFAVPQTVPEHEKEKLRTDLGEVLKFVGILSQGGCYALSLTSEARDIFESWYFALEHSTFAKRLDTYGHRLMILLAVNELQTTITPEIAEKTVALLDYQLAARKFADPIDADNAIARLEERIRRLLAPGPLSKRVLERRGNKARVGTWAWNTAINNLVRDKELVYEWKTKTYFLAPE